MNSIKEQLDFVLLFLYFFSNKLHLILITKNHSYYSEINNNSKLMEGEFNIFLIAASLNDCLNFLLSTR